MIGKILDVSKKKNPLLNMGVKILEVESLW